MNKQTLWVPLEQEMEKTQCEMKGEREIPAAAARSLWCPGMLMDIVYLVSSDDHFGSMRERGRERDSSSRSKILMMPRYAHGYSIFSE